MATAEREPPSRAEARREPYVPLVMQPAERIQPASIRVPQAAVALLGPVLPGLRRPGADAAFLADLEAHLAGAQDPSSWRWELPRASYYSPQAVVALLDAEAVAGWRERLAEALHVDVGDVDAALARAQGHWDLARWTDGVFHAESQADLRTAAQLARLGRRRHRLSRLEDPVEQVPGAIGTAAQREQLRQVVAGRDGSPHRWRWLLPKAKQQALHDSAAQPRLDLLREGVAAAAALLRGRPLGRWAELATVIELIGALESARGDCLRELGRLQDTLDATPRWRWRARRDLKDALGSHIARERTITERVGDLGDLLDALERPEQERHAWDQEHAEVLARGEIYARRLQQLERHAVLALERDPPPYLHRALGRSFPYVSTAQRRFWLAGARTVEYHRADVGAADRHDPFGPAPDDPPSRARHTETVQLVEELRACIEHLDDPQTGTPHQRTMEPPTATTDLDGP